MTERLKAIAAQYLNPKNEPVVTMYLAVLIGRVVASAGFDIDAANISGVIEPFIASAFVVARGFVTPTAKLA